MTSLISFVIISRKPSQLTVFAIPVENIVGYLNYRYHELQLLEKDSSVTVHHKNLQALVTEIFKVKNDLAPDIMKDVFELKEPPIQPTIRIKSLYTPKC